MPTPIPTQYQDSKQYSNAARGNFNKPAALSGLYDAADQARQEAETYQRLNAGGTADEKDALIEAAQQTLRDTQPAAARLAHVDSDAAAAREQYRTEGEASPIAPFANAAKEVGGIGMFANLIPGGQIVGVPSEVLYGLGSAAKAMDPYSHADMGERLGEGAQAGLMAAPALWKGAKRMTPGVSMAKDLGSTEIPMAFSDKQSSIPAVRHYWDALDLGQEPAQAVKIGAGRDKGARAALEALQKAGKGSEGAVEQAAKTVPTPPARSVPSDPLAHFGDAHTTPGVDANTVLDADGRPLGNQGDYNPAHNLSLPGAQAYMARESQANAPLVERITSTWGNRRTGRTAEELQALADALSGQASAATPPAMRGLLKQEIPNNLTMETPEEALTFGKDEASKRSVMFGGAGSKQGGSHVRPSNRTPVGAR